MEDFIFYCPHCGQKMLCPAQYDGLEKACPTCGQTILLKNTIKKQQEFSNKKNNNIEKPYILIFLERASVFQIVLGVGGIILSLIIFPRDLTYGIIILSTSLGIIANGGAYMFFAEIIKSLWQTSVNTERIYNLLKDKL